MTQTIKLDNIDIRAINSEKLSSDAFVSTVKEQLQQLADQIDNSVDYVSFGAVLQRGADTLTIYELNGENTVPSQATINSTTTYLEGQDADIGSLFGQLAAVVSGKISEVEDDEGRVGLEYQLGDDEITRLITGASVVLDDQSDDEEE